MSGANFNMGVAYISAVKNPFQIFNTWKTEAQLFLMHTYTNCFSLATVSKDNVVRNRTVYTFQEFKDRFVFSTNKHGQKYADIMTHPQVSGTFLWHYKDGETTRSRQVRLEGTIKQLDRSISTELFEKAPLFVKVRTVVAKQGTEVNWEELNKKVEELVRDVKENGRILECPEYEVTFELVPHYIEFYDSYNEYFADRLAYTKDSNNQWTYKHLAA